MTIRSTMWCAALTLAMGACRPESPGGPRSTDLAVVATRVSGGVRIANGSAVTISYVVVNPAWLGLLASCVDPGARCPTVAARSVVTVPEGDIYGFSADARRLVARYWPVGAKDAAGTEVVVTF